jgi:hypothetical protein
MKPGYVQTLISILVVSFFVCFYALDCMAQGDLSRPTNPGAGAHSYTLTVGGLYRVLAWQSDGPPREHQAITKVAKETDGDGGA